MFRSLHMKLVLILVLLIVSVMVVVGTFLINNVASYYIDDFKRQMKTVFSVDFIGTLNDTASDENAANQLSSVIWLFSGSLGINTNRDFYILDYKTGNYLTGSNEVKGRELELTRNIISAMSGEVGEDVSNMDSYMDLAVPVISKDGTNRFIVYIRDTKEELNNLTWMLFAVTVQAILFGLIVAILLSFLLSKTISAPIERLTRSAALIASGEFSHKIEVHSSDEIGVLTSTFNNMAGVLKETLDEIESERNKLNTLFLHMADGVVAFAPGGGVLHMNPAAQRMLGIPYTSGLNYKDIFSDLVLPKNEDEADEKEYFEMSYEKNGKAFKLFFAPFGISENETGIMTVIHDITEQTKLDESRREFVANVSHELRTPLTSIKSYAETLIESEDADPETKRQFLGIILKEADRMTRIVKDLLTLSRLDWGKMQLTYSDFSVKSVLESVYNAMLMDAMNHKQTLTLDLAGSLPDVTGDRERVEQVIVNIVSNAIKYTQDGGKIKIRADRQDESIVIEVSDNGIGIPEEDLGRIFDRFYRVDKARSRERGGTGLGLAIAKEIIELHSGTIKIDSQLNKGTTVSIFIPIVSSPGE